MAGDPSVASNALIGTSSAEGQAEDVAGAPSLIVVWRHAAVLELLLSAGTALTLTSVESEAQRIETDLNHA